MHLIILPLFLLKICVDVSGHSSPFFLFSCSVHPPPTAVLGFLVTSNGLNFPIPLFCHPGGATSLCRYSHQLKFPFADTAVVQGGSVILRGSLSPEHLAEIQASGGLLPLAT